MLSKLHIENIAVIEKTEIDFSDGLNILTGETGAGKSIILDAINAVMGMRTSRELIRTGAQTAKVIAVFSNLSSNSKQKLAELSYGCEDDELLIQREISDTKNVCRINGMPANTALLRELGQVLINIHGQHENQALLNVENHIIYLDKLGDYFDILKEYNESFEEMLTVKRERDKIVTDEEEKARKIELLEYQINELTNADITLGEQEELKKRQQQFQNHEKIASSLYNASIYLNGDDDSQGSISLLKSAVNSYAEACSYLEEDKTELLEKMNEVLYSLEEYSDDIAKSIDNLDYDERDINQVEERLDLLYKLGRKYGKSDSEMLEFLENAVSELEEIKMSDENILLLNEKYGKLHAKTSNLAKELTECRKKAANNFSKMVKAELSFLDMNNLTLTVETKQKELSQNGADEVEFLISANIGEMPKSIAKIASGGELSRIMLAIKNVLADKDDIDTLIFDEIDSGMSGLAASKVGEKLKQVSKNRQIICVTHLAQIAAQAKSHLYISKEIKNNRTYTKVDVLEEKQRIYELARMSSGANITDITLENAKEMLLFAQNA